MVVVDHRAQVPGRLLGKRIRLQQARHRLGAREQPFAEAQEPGLAARVAERGEPHLPIQPRHVRRHEFRTAPHIARLPAELVGFPLAAILAAFDRDLRPSRGHDREQPIRVHHPKRRLQPVERGERLEPVDAVAKRAEERHQARREQRAGEDRLGDSRAPRREIVAPALATQPRREKSIVDQHQAERDRQQVEDAVVAGE